jgi:hypothetical protein
VYVIIIFFLYYYELIDSGSRTHRFNNTLFISLQSGRFSGHFTSKVLCAFLVLPTVPSYIIIIIIIAGHSGLAVSGVGLGRLVAGIVGSNPA